MLVDALFRGLERRATVIDPRHPKDPGIAALFGYSREAASGVSVDDETALTFGAVFSCVKVLAETLGSVPLHVYERIDDGGKRRATAHALYHVLHSQPNEYMTSAELREAGMLSLGLRGNFIATLDLDSRENVTQIWPVHGATVKPRIRDGRLWYVITDQGGERIKSAKEVLHVRGLGWGFWGLSPIDYAREAIGLGIAAERFGAKFYAQGTALSGVLESAKPLGDEGRRRLQAGWSAARTGEKGWHTTPVLEDGVKWVKMGVDPDNAQFLETRKFQAADVARWYRVPLHMIGELDRATFSNVEHQSLEFIKFTMLPWFFKWEQAMMRDLFGPMESTRYFPEFAVQGLERGDMAARVGYYQGMSNAGAISANEIRALENMSPRDGGDVYLEPMNTRPSGTPASAPQPGAQPAARVSLLPVAQDAAFRMAKAASRELHRLAKRHLESTDLDTFASEVGSLWGEQERRCAEMLRPLAAAAGVTEEGARRAAAVWASWSGSALTAATDVESVTRIAERLCAASDAAGAAILASLQEAA